MKTFKRIITSIVRNPFQSVLMFLIVFVLGNVLFASIAVKQSSESVKQELRARTSSYLFMIKTHDGDETNNTNKLRMLVNELNEKDTVKNVKVFETITIYEPIEIKDNSASYNVNCFNSIARVEDSYFDYEIVDGRFFTQEELDNGERKILLDKWMGYEVGDTYTVYLPDYEVIEEREDYGEHSFTIRIEINAKMENREKYEFEVIGLYEDRTLKKDFKEEQETLKLGYEISEKCIEEMVMMHQEVMDRHPDFEKEYLDDRARWIDEEYFSLNHETSAVYVNTNGIDANEQVESEVLDSENYPSYYYKIKTSAQEYRYIQAPLENLVALANVALGASAVLAIILLALVANLFIKYRTKEVGVLMAIGEKRSHLLVQFVGEILIVGLFATSFAMVSGNYLGSEISNEFMRIQIDVDSEMEYQEKNPDMLTQIDLLETYEIEMNAEYIITIYVASTFILILSSALPIINILKVKPKEVLM